MYKPLSSGHGLSVLSKRKPHMSCFDNSMGGTLDEVGMAIFEGVIKRLVSRVGYS